MKRFHKTLLSAAVSGALLFSAQAAEPQNTAQDILQSTLPVVQQEWKNTGTISTTSFSDENYSVQISELLPQKQLYTIRLSMTGADSSSRPKSGVLNPQTGTLLVPVEYDSIQPLSDGTMLLWKFDSAQTSYWFADETGALTPMKLPSGYELATYEPNSNVFILFKNVKKPVYDPYSGDGPATLVEDVPFFALADKDMNIILDDIDMVPDWYADFFIVKTGSTKWERVDKASADGNGTYGLFDPKTGKFVGKHDFNQIFWYDQHFIGTRSSGTKSYLLDGKGGETLLPANVKEYSSWAKTEVAAAGEHGLTESFSYPKLDITRANFTQLAMRLYRKVYPEKEIPKLENQFTDCNDADVAADVRDAAALGIVTGYSANTFRPYKTISRQEAATMLDRLYAALGGQTELIADPAYADDAQLGDWARGSVYAMRQTGIMQGKSDNRFCPKDGYTAEQAIVTMERLYQLITP